MMSFDPSILDEFGMSFKCTLFKFVISFLGTLHE